MSTKTRELTGRHVLLIVLGAFALVLAVNTIFITLAVRTFTGEEVSDAYSRGLAYNEVLEERAAQQSLGWTASLVTSAETDGILSVEVVLTDAADAAVTGAEVELLLRRPTHAGEDVTLDLAEGPEGTYRGQITLPGSGVWDARGQVIRREYERLDFEERLWVQ